MEYYLAMNMKKVVIHAAAWMDAMALCWVEKKPVPKVHILYNCLYNNLKRTKS